MKTHVITAIVCAITIMSVTATAKSANDTPPGATWCSLCTSVPDMRPVNVEIVKRLVYTDHTLEDSYAYNGSTREFQWDRIRQTLIELEYGQRNPSDLWVTLQNYKNKNGTAPLTASHGRDAYNTDTDIHGTSRTQAIPLYSADNFSVPTRYGRDGTLFRYLKDTAGYVKICSMIYDGSWYVPEKYVKKLSTNRFDKVIFVDRTNQNIATLEKGEDDIWYVLSMNPATTGLHNPPYQQETPLGTYVVQEHKPKMYYLKDGSSAIAGFAPWASRFTRGAYIHGVPLNNPDATQKDYIEFTWTLGTTPRSHMCVRNATSHAKYIYDWATPLESLVVVIE